MKMKDWWLVYLLLLSSVEANNWPEYYGPSSTTISEAAPIGAEVFQFSVSDVDDDPLTVIINYNKQFNLVINSPSNYSVTLKDTIDRETMSRYDLQVTISDGTVQESVDVRIRVEDVNDFVPIIKNTQLSASVRENQPMGTFVINITTEDEDSGYNAATEIILDDETLPFYLGDPSTKEPLEHSYGRATVLIRESLDYEQQPLYSVAVTVTDMAGCVGAACQTPLSTTQTLRVTVLDEQDTPPYFTSLPYVAQTHENLPVGSKIIQILALDGDTSARRNVEYFFVTSSGEFVGRLGYFSIDPSSGEITNAEVIDADSAEVKAQASFYTLNVTAKEVLRDGEVEQPELDQSFASVSVSILDVNDERPIFSTNAISASIMEGLPAGSSVQFNDTLKVVDLDQGANGVFTLRALTEAGEVSPWFNVIPQRVINEATISLTTKDMIDYEANSTITIKIEAKDLQSGAVTFKTVDIDVEDSNDNSPTFSSAVYEATVVENSVRHTAVSSNTQIIATDIDSGSYGVVFYSLETEQDVFNIDPESAEITVACDRCLDRELEPVYYLVIEAIDGGGLLDTAQLTITVTDVNDHAPQFTADVYEASVNENTLQFVTPLNVQANDADEGSNAIVSYSLLNYTDHFDINSNGSVFITQALDAEAVSDVLEVTVSARDMGTPALNSTAVIRVQVLDMNDKTPQFGQSSPFRNISEDATIGTIIYTAHATDDDRSSPNKDITYSLLYGGFHQFRIEPQTGHIRVNSSLDRESSRNEYSLVVRASDRGQPPLSSQQTIVVKVTDVNDEAPVFLQNEYAFEIEEGQDANTPVGTVQATDPDTNKIIKYNITETKAFNSDDTAVELQNDPFSINYSTGLLLVSSVLDRETVSRVELTVTAQDVNGLQPQISTVKVKIEIIDVNDNPPVIQPVGILEVEEGDYSASEPRLVTQLTVIDQDLDSRFDYSLSLNPFSAYSVNDNGEVYLISSIDRENVGSWLNFTAVVQDGALSSSLDVTVKVMDVNDNTPQFVEFADELVVPETARLGLILTRVRAVDTDSDAVNRQIKYSITSGSLNRVTINETTGLVTVSGDLDRDAQQIPNNRLSLIIKACDTGDPMLCQSKAMTIRITEVNDNTPTFSRAIYNATALETAQFNDDVLVAGAQIEATDIDASPNGQIVRYSCCNPGNDTQGLFKISEDGKLKVASSTGLQGHTGIYKLTVNATDWGAPTKTGSAIVYVHVNDVNDHSPVLSVYNSGSEVVHRPEYASKGDAVITILASDEDEGDNAVVDLVFITDDPTIPDFALFYIERSENSDSNKFVIRQNIAFDRENATQYKFGIRGEDRGVPQLVSEPLTITVNIDDENDNRPYFPADKQIISVTVEEEKAGAYVGVTNFAQDDDDGNTLCYSIIGARNSIDSLLPAHETIIERLFRMNSLAGEVWLKDEQKLDREGKNTYILVIQADDSDGNVYNNCENPPSVPWVSRRTRSNEMELHITVEDIDDNPPVFSERIYYLAAVRGVAAPSTFVNLKDYVTDPDKSQVFNFSRGKELNYIPASLSSTIKTPDPVKVLTNGDIASTITFTSNMKGRMSFGAVATDAAGHSAESQIIVYIIDKENVATLTVSKDVMAVQMSRSELTEMFLKQADWNVSIISIRDNPDKNYHSDIEFFVVPKTGESLLSSTDIYSMLTSDPILLEELQRYGYVETPRTDRNVDEENPQSNKQVVIIVVIVAVVLVVLITLMLVLCYVMRNMYKRKLKAAHAMAFDQSDIPQSVNNIPGATKQSAQISPQQAAWSHDPPLNNFDWGTANGGFDSESHRSSHSHDDNAIDPLNSVETQSCSSAGSNDWRLDLRGNNLDCSPPPQPANEVEQAVLNEHNNQLSCETKFVDSQSDRSSSRSSTNKDCHFNPLIMSDSVYGKIYETRRMPNGLETTEV